MRDGGFFLGTSGKEALPHFCFGHLGEWRFYHALGAILILTMQEMDLKARNENNKISSSARYSDAHF